MTGTFSALFRVEKVRFYSADTALFMKLRTNVRPKTTYRFTFFQQMQKQIRDLLM